MSQHLLFENVRSLVPHNELASLEKLFRPTRHTKTTESRRLKKEQVSDANARPITERERSESPPDLQLPRRKIQKDRQKVNFMEPVVNAQMHRQEHAVRSVA